jgi:type IV secretion system protein VirB3
MDDLESEPLFLALTRPAMRWGVPFEALVLNGVLSFFVGLWLDNPFFWLIGIAIHFPMRIIASRDHNFFRVGRLWMTTKGQALRSASWGGSMLSPLPHFEQVKPKESASNV